MHTLARQYKRSLARRQREREPPHGDWVS